MQMEVLCSCRMWNQTGVGSCGCHELLCVKRSSVLMLCGSTQMLHGLQGAPTCYADYR